jgi:hypothetical protein
MCIKDGNTYAINWGAIGAIAFCLAVWVAIIALIVGAI